jgi:sugar lactone lactonase YvrE
MKLILSPLIISVLTLLGCNTPPLVDKETQAISEPPDYFTYHPDHLFPGDGSLNRAEDGVSLPDGSVIVVDQISGLRLIEKNGKSRPFGDFASAGFIHNPPDQIPGPNGVVLQAGGTHLLMSDVFTGKLYQVDIATEEVEMFYNHPYGVNTLYSDGSGAIWFTQSAKSTNVNELFQAIDLPIPTGAVYRMADIDSEPVKLIDSLYFANGITMDQSEQYLFVAETMMDRIQSFKINLSQGEIIDQDMAAFVPAPDNIMIDHKGRLVVALPLFNQVMALNLERKNIQVLFDGSTTENRKITQEWMLRSQLGMERLELLTPELSNPLPGLVTGMFYSNDKKALYISSLGNDLLRYDL